MMTSTTFNLYVSYSQIAIFWSSLQQPFNLWTQRHIDQGFAWRPGSVSFGTLVESGTHSVQLDVTNHAEPVSAAVVRAIEVPFEVPTDGGIEVASISDSVPLSLPVGKYSLRCEFLGKDEEDIERVRLVLATADVQHFAVVRGDDDLIIEDELLIAAEPAPSDIE